MNALAQFPYMSPSEFEASCRALSDLHVQHADLQSDWLAVESIRSDSGSYLKITKALDSADSHRDNGDTASEPDEVVDDDEETVATDTAGRARVEFDITLSPTYQVLVLYFSIKDPGFRFPPTMDTLYRCIVPSHLKAQTQHIGVLGGITVADHPFTNSPVFFIHPCQTAALLEASVNTKDITPPQYLTLWIGAICSHVGLNLSPTFATSLAANNVSQFNASNVVGL